MESEQPDIFDRVEGIFETSKLSGKTVTIIGLGTGGSLCADELARCAVDNFRLIDFDRLEVHNIARHICGMKDVGQYKTHAIAERLRDINPNAIIETYEVDITKETKILERALSGCDLVLVCTDNNVSRYLINQICLQNNVPAVYAGAYERAFGGFVMRVIPGQTPCYDCVIGSLQTSIGEMPRKGGPIPYSELEDASEFRAEPGLSIDAHMIALIQAKMALLTLLRKEETTLEDYPTDFLLWGNRREWIFPEPLYCKFAKTAFRKECPTCQSVRMKKAEQDIAVKDAKDIIDNAAYNPDLFPKK